MSQLTDKYSHHAHILPLKVYLGIGGTLIFMTLVTVAVAQVHLGPFNLLVALAIAVFKAILVGLFFMHLKYDNKLFAVIFVSSLAFLGIFISITLFDTLRRGDIYQEVGMPIKANSNMYDSLRVAPAHGASGHEGATDKATESVTSGDDSSGAKATGHEGTGNDSGGAKDTGHVATGVESPKSGH